MDSSPAPPHEGKASLTRWQKAGVLALVLCTLIFGGLVELRSAFLKRHMTDLGVYLRAAWAVRTGEDIYDVTDDNGWHYQYPPIFAILMSPLADPPPGTSRQWMLPFALSVAIWYLFSLACLCWAVDQIARALEERGRLGTEAARAQQWLALRLVPIVICIVPIAHTLMRGQVNLLLLALLAGTAASMLRGRDF